MELDWSVIDINGYPQHIQKHLKQLIEDPGSLPARSLSEVTDIIVSRSYRDLNYYAAGAQVCKHIIEADLMCTLFHDHGASIMEGSDAHMEDIMMAIRDTFLSTDTDITIQSLLLPLIKMYASSFSLDEQAKFYFHM